MNDLSPYRQFAEMMRHGDSRWIPEILKRIVDDEEARLLVALPGTAREMAEALNRPLESVERDLKGLFRKGLAFKKEKQGVVTWRAPGRLVQFHDASLVWPEAPPELLDLWRNYMEEEYPAFAREMARQSPQRHTRVIPVGKSLDPGKVQVIAPENLKEIVNSARRFAVTDCTCRLSMRKCDAPVEVCLQIDRGADYAIERGTGRELSKAEAMEVIEASEEAGLVHVAMNKAGLGNFICNCCGCCCLSFSLLTTAGLRRCESSRYRPTVDVALCTACGTCEDRCWFGAIAVNGGDAAAVDVEKCLGCGQCAIGCPEEAITMLEVKGADFIPE
jgi:Pyruvate/2-oxoacid:ferredoxin oxidoreductase delta subunit